MRKRLRSKPSFKNLTGKEQAEELDLLLKAGLYGRPNAPNPNAEYLLNKPTTPGTELGFPIPQKTTAKRVLTTPSEELALREPTALARSIRKLKGGKLVKSKEAAAAAATEAGSLGPVLGKLAKGAVGVALISYLLQSGQEMAQELIRSKAEAGQMDLAQMAYSPENAQQQAMLPINRSQKQAALYMLLQKMGGGGGRPMLADGESLT